ncbi:MAG: catalase [Nocardioidaceae bacterium]|nr:catalase [Nocardioidaceae bacterium]
MSSKGVPVPDARQPDQTTPELVGPVGAPTVEGMDPDWRAQQGRHLTSAQGVRLPDTDRSLKAGQRGPTLMEDFHFREKITHFDHERIPERVVHARGAGAHGVFRAYGNAAQWTRAAFLSGKDAETPVFVRFSTVLGSRGSADTVRDVRGFAVKFYTDEGNFDLVGNNMPVFFIQDAIKFPDIIHAGKPHPDREIPQAQSAHDTFWDFVSLHTEATHMLMWLMSDRAIPRSYRTMEGFGVHTFRLVDGLGDTVLVKFHWKPVAGIHSLVWEEAQLAAGMDPDFHRRDLADAIEAGAFPEWELGLQVMPDSEDQMFEGIDLLDPTKVVPEELAPVQPVGRLTLNANPTNYFAETEQIAFHTGHLVSGIEVTDDPLMQGRMFSYLDTQLTRLGGPNFSQLPINRPHAAVNDMLRDGMHQTAVHTGIAPYLPNSLGDGDPQVADAKAGAYIPTPRRVAGPVVRESPVSFGDHYSQASLFWNSMTQVEKLHIVEAFTFELAKCFEQPVRDRMLGNLGKIHADLCMAVAAGLGIPTPSGLGAADSSAELEMGVDVSPALSQLPLKPGPIAGRRVGVIVDDGGDLAGVSKLRETLESEGAKLHVIAPHGGTVRKGARTEIVERMLLTTRSIEFDAIVVADGAGALTDRRAITLLEEAFRHCKAVAAWGDGVNLLSAAGIGTNAPGVLVSEKASAGQRKALVQAMGMHRAWARLPQLLEEVVAT